jgi:hypothetical protein
VRPGWFLIHLCLAFVASEETKEETLDEMSREARPDEEEKLSWSTRR